MQEKTCISWIFFVSLYVISTEKGRNMENRGLNTKQLGNLFGVDESTVRRFTRRRKDY